MEHKTVTTKCPCGNVITIPFGNGEYGVVYNIFVKCESCCNVSTAGNCRTGEITEWADAETVKSSNNDYNHQKQKVVDNSFKPNLL